LEQGGAPEPDLSACHLLSHVLDMPSNGFSQLLHILEGNNRPSGIASKQLSKAQSEKYRSFLQRRMQHEPVQYILGEWDFYDFTIKCRAPILCPRPETEELVEWVKDDTSKLLESTSSSNKASLRILDVGCGTGAIGLALARMFPNASITAIDISPEAVALSMENASMLNLVPSQNEISNPEQPIRYQALLSSAKDFNIKLNEPGFDIVVSNPPYIPPNDMATLTPDVMQYESHDALCGGTSEDGLDVIRDIISRLPEWTKSAEIGQGSLYMEVDPSQPSLLEQSLGKCGNGVDIDNDSHSPVGFVATLNDFCGRERFVKLRVRS
jgi:release factor glutamine methyltransferase